MGRKRIEQLLEQLKENQQAELENAAAIYTVAKVAVNTLRQVVDESEQLAGAIAPLPAAALAIDKAELLRRYGSHNGCRTAARKHGITFKKTPSWEQLVAAFNQVETLRNILKSHLLTYPCPLLRGTMFQFTIDEFD